MANHFTSLHHALLKKNHLEKSDKKKNIGLTNDLPTTSRKNGVCLPSPINNKIVLIWPNNPWSGGIIKND